MLRIGIIGLGYWGPNLLRVFDSIPGAKVSVICDRDPLRLRALSLSLPGVHCCADAEALLESGLADAVVIATPTATHFRLAQAALRRGLHTFVEKPLAQTSAECAALAEMAARQGLTLMVGHVYLFNIAIAKLGELVRAGALGKVRSIAAIRSNLGPVRSDVNSLWDLAPHDISIILHLLGEMPTSVNCQGVAFLNRRVHDVCVLTMQFASGTMATVQTSWVHPTKVRQMTLVGSRQMAVFDDMQQRDKIRIFDRSVEIAPRGAPGARVRYREGVEQVPELLAEEPLLNECSHFVECVVSGRDPVSGPRNGAEVVQVLEAADHSLRSGGGPSRLPPLARVVRLPRPRATIAARAHPELVH